MLKSPIRLFLSCFGQKDTVFLIVGKSKGSSHKYLNCLPSKFKETPFRKKVLLPYIVKGSVVARLPLQGTFKWCFLPFSSMTVISAFLCCTKILINFLHAWCNFFFFSQISYHESLNTVRKILMLIS